MSSQNKQNEAIELLAKNEEAMSRLYKIFAKKFPDFHDFWSGLADDESDHYNKILMFHSKIKEGSARFVEGRFSDKDIQVLLEATNVALAQVEDAEMPLKDALLLAFYMEKSLIERNFFEVFTTDSPELKQLLADLETETKRHRGKLEEALEPHRLKV